MYSPERGHISLSEAKQAPVCLNAAFNRISNRILFELNFRSVLLIGNAPSPTPTHLKPSFFSLVPLPLTFKALLIQNAITGKSDHIILTETDLRPNRTAKVIATTTTTTTTPYTYVCQVAHMDLWRDSSTNGIQQSYICKPERDFEHSNVRKGGGNYAPETLAWPSGLSLLRGSFF